MATRGTITVKVNEKDKEVALKVTKEFLDKHNAIYTEKSFNTLWDVIIPKNCNYISIYHHWDSYPSGLGETLEKEYNDYESALMLCLCGSMSSINKGIDSYVLSGDEEWEYNCPEFGETTDELNKESYNYLFEDGKWKIID